MSRRCQFAVCAAIVLLSLLAYGPMLSLPFISDDYVQIGLARQYGPVSGWSELARDPLYRCRATSLLLTWWKLELFGLSPWIYNVFSLAVHILNCLLVFALGAWPLVGWRVAAAAAMFFAVYEGHQEAVVWYAALPELLVAVFVLASVVFWLGWLRGGPRRRWYYRFSLGCFILALFSKESAVVVVALAPIAAAIDGKPWRDWLRAALPFAALAALYSLASVLGQARNVHFYDGTFSLGGHFLVTLAVSVFRLFWFWGLLGLLAAVVLRLGRWKTLLLFAGCWILITLLPYSFLTYMPRVPSRHVYLASIGLALVAGVAFLEVSARLGPRWRPAPVLLALLMVGHNSGYLWWKKLPQYVERAAPTEELIRVARSVDGPVFVECFPYAPEVAWRALEIAAGRDRSTTVFDPSRGRHLRARYCYQGPLMPGR